MHRLIHRTLRNVAFTLAALTAFSNNAEAADNFIAIQNATIETVGPKGRIENGTILIGDGKVVEVGKNVEIPISAQIIDASGQTITPGFIDPYFTVSIGRNVQASAPRTVVFRGRVFVVGGGSPAIATTFARVEDGLDLSSVEWSPSKRSGITFSNLVSAGYSLSAFAKMTSAGATIADPTGEILITLTNNTKSLDVLRKGLKSPDGGSKNSDSKEGGSKASEGEKGAGTKDASTEDEYWADIRSGKRAVFVNVNNASAILHTLASGEEDSDAKLIFIASGEDIFRTLDNLNPKKHSVILEAQVDTVPNSQIRVNVPALLAERGIPFAFSQTLAQSNFRNQQHNPLFSTAMLVHTGLDRDKALEALTLQPAKMLGLDKQLGSLEPGKTANLVILDGDPFASTTGVVHTFVEGKLIDVEK